jgi:hypothetical protein
MRGEDEKNRRPFQSAGAAKRNGDQKIEAPMVIM